MDERFIALTSLRGVSKRFIGFNDIDLYDLQGIAHACNSDPREFHRWITEHPFVTRSSLDTNPTMGIVDTWSTGVCPGIHREFTFEVVTHDQIKINDCISGFRKLGEDMWYDVDWYVRGRGNGQVLVNIGWDREWISTDSREFEIRSCKTSPFANKMSAKRFQDMVDSLRVVC